MTLGIVRLEGGIELEARWCSGNKDILWMDIKNRTLKELFDLFYGYSGRIEYRDEVFTGFNRIAVINDNFEGSVKIALKKEQANDE